jgi:hypothetical protein
MSFGLLTPLFLAGLAAVAIPILVHLVRREERTSFAFPSLMFLSHIPVREHRRRTIRHWWLLALRCLIIALLCFAFAKPFIEWPASGVALAGNSRDRIVLLDRSHSMQSGSRWAEARKIAAEAIDELGRGERAALVLFDHDTLVTQELTSDNAALGGALSGAKTGHGHTDLIAAIERASALLAKSQAVIREIVLISDFQRSAVESGKQARIAPGVDLIPHNVAGAEQANAAVAAVKLAHHPLGAGDAAVLTARIVNTGSLPIDDTELVMEVDGQDRERRLLSLTPGESRDETFRLVLAPEDLLQVRIHIGADALDADNSFHVMVSGPTAIAVLLLEDRSAPPEKTLHLEEALRQGDAPDFRVTRRFVSQLRTSDIDAADVIIIDDAPIPGGSPGESLRNFLQSGGGLLVVTGGRTQGSWPNGEQGIVPGRLGATRIRPERNAARLMLMNTLHPALATFADSRGGDLSSAQVFRYRRLTGVAEQAVLARYDDESVAIAERQVGRGRALVLTTTLDPSWNTLAMQPGYLPFVHEALKYLASHVPATSAVAVSDTLDLESYAKGLPGYRQSAVALSRGAVVTLRTPSGKQIHMAPGEAYTRVREAGFHEVHVSGGGARSVVFAANPLHRESDLTPLDVSAFVATIATTGIEDDTSEAGQSTGVYGGDPTADERAWRFLLVVCALLLGLDTLLSNRLSRPVQAS